MAMDKKNVLSTVLIAAAAVILIALGAIYGTGYLKGKAGDKKAALDSLVENIALTPEALAEVDLEGTYSFKIEADTLSSRYTASVKRGLDDTYIITVHSDYEPESYPFKVEDGVLISERLGRGTVSHQELTGKLMLQFRQDNSTSTLVKYDE